MSAVTGVLQDLIQRRLWPVAVLLIAAAVAAPVVLASDPVAPPAPAPNAGAGADAQPIASLVDDFSAGERRRVLGAAKDPFAPSGRQAGPAATPGASDEAPAPGGGGPSAGGSGGPTAPGGGPGGPAPASGGGGGPVSPAGDLPAPSPAPVPTPAPGGGETETYALHSLKVSWDEGEPRQLARLEPLPDAETPAVIYLGLLKDARTAVFLLDEGVRSEGDGSCHPSPEDCQRVHLRKGETQFFDVPAADGEGIGTAHQLDLISITTKRTASAAKAKRAYARASKAGRRALRRRAERAGRLRYDARSGVLRRVSREVHEAGRVRAALAGAALRLTPVR